jgi:glycosyltransferase involved in cell wall biosynthesis
MTDKKKLKVLWYCTVNNSIIQDYLKPKIRTNEKAPWILNAISIFENDDSIELHVVFPHQWTTGYREFDINGVHYHCFNPFYGMQWPKYFNRFDVLTDFYFLKKRFSKIVKKIAPDIIHMHGAENLISTGITQFYNKYSVLITIQGFINKSEKYKKIVDHQKVKNTQNSIFTRFLRVLNNQSDVIFEKTVQKEFEIMKMFNHFGYRTETMGHDIKEINPKAILHWHRYPFKVIEPYQVDKEYDIVYFARMEKDKGIEDLLYAIALIKNDKPDISLCAIGGGGEQFENLTSELGIKENVFWAGFLPTQEEVHRLASTAQISVLPTYHDIIPGTIIESLFLKIPVISYNVGSIHELNENIEVVKLSHKGDIEGLAKNILLLLIDEKLRNILADNGLKIAKEKYDLDNEIIRKQFIDAYYEVLRY